MSKSNKYISIKFFSSLTPEEQKQLIEIVNNATNNKIKEEEVTIGFTRDLLNL